jgi:hypothetical protein
VRLIVERTIIVIFLIIALLIALSLPAPVLNMTMCISAVDDVMQITVAHNTLSVVHLRWCDAAGCVPIETLPVAIVVTQVSVLLVVNRVCHGCCV